MSDVGTIRPGQPGATLERVRSIVFAALDGRPVTVYLFGSWARGEQRHSSDIDVAVDAPAALPPGVMARVREALEESTVPYRVDVVELRTAPPEFRDRVRREGIAWTGSASA